MDKINNTLSSSSHPHNNKVDQNLSPYHQNYPGNRSDDSHHENSRVEKIYTPTNATNLNHYTHSQAEAAYTPAYLHSRAAQAYTPTTRIAAPCPPQNHISQPVNPPHIPHAVPATVRGPPPVSSLHSTHPASPTQVRNLPSTMTPTYPEHKPISREVRHPISDQDRPIHTTLETTNQKEVRQDGYPAHKRERKRDAKDGGLDDHLELGLELVGKVVKELG